MRGLAATILCFFFTILYAGGDSPLKSSVRFQRVVSDTERKHWQQKFFKNNADAVIMPRSVPDADTAVRDEDREAPDDTVDNDVAQPPRTVPVIRRTVTPPPVAEVPDTASSYPALWPVETPDAAVKAVEETPDATVTPTPAPAPAPVPAEAPTVAAPPPVPVEVPDTAPRMAPDETKLRPDTAPAAVERPDVDTAPVEKEKERRFLKKKARGGGSEVKDHTVTQ